MSLLHASGVQQTTQTVGRLPLVLDPTDRFLAFAAAFPLGVRFAYGILDVDGGALEYGMGYLSSATVLEREQILQTTSSTGEVERDPGRRADLPAGPKTVINIGPGERAPASWAQHSTAIDSDARIAMNGLATLGQTPATINAADVVDYYPFRILSGGFVDAIAFSATAAPSGVSIGLYGIDGKGEPGVRLLACAPYSSGAGGVNIVELDAPVYVAAGDYYAAVVASGATSAALAIGVAQWIDGFLGRPPTDWTMLQVRTETLSGGWTELPAVASPDAIQVRPSVWDVGFRLRAPALVPAMRYDQPVPDALDVTWPDDDGDGPTLSNAGSNPIAIVPDAVTDEEGVWFSSDSLLDPASTEWALQASPLTIYGIAEVPPTDEGVQRLFDGSHHGAGVARLFLDYDFTGQAVIFGSLAGSISSPRGLELGELLVWAAVADGASSALYVNDEAAVTGTLAEDGLDWIRVGLATSGVLPFRGVFYLLELHDGRHPTAQITSKLAELVEKWKPGVRPLLNWYGAGVSGEGASLRWAAQRNLQSASGSATLSPEHGSTVRRYLDPLTGEGGVLFGGDTILNSADLGTLPAPFACYVVLRAPDGAETTTTQERILDRRLFASDSVVLEFAPNYATAQVNAGATLSGTRAVAPAETVVLSFVVDGATGRIALNNEPAIVGNTGAGSWEPIGLGAAAWNGLHFNGAILSVEVRPGAPAGPVFDAFRAELVAKHSAGFGRWLGRYTPAVPPAGAPPTWKSTDGDPAADYDLDTYGHGAGADWSVQDDPITGRPMLRSRGVDSYLHTGELLGTLLHTGPTTHFGAALIFEQDPLGSYVLLDGSSDLAGRRRVVWWDGTRILAAYAAADGPGDRAEIPVALLRRLVVFAARFDPDASTVDLWIDDGVSRQRHTETATFTSNLEGFGVLGAPWGAQYAPAGLGEALLLPLLTTDAYVDHELDRLSAAWLPGTRERAAGHDFGPDNLTDLGPGVGINWADLVGLALLEAGGTVDDSSLYRDPVAVVDMARNIGAAYLVEDPWPGGALSQPFSIVVAGIRDVRETAQTLFWSDLVNVSLNAADELALFAGATLAASTVKAGDTFAAAVTIDGASSSIYLRSTSTPEGVYVEGAGGSNDSGTAVRLFANGSGTNTTAAKLSRLRIYPGVALGEVGGELEVGRVVDELQSLDPRPLYHLAPAGIDSGASTWTTEDGELVFSPDVGAQHLSVIVDEMSGLEAFRGRARGSESEFSALSAAAALPLAMTNESTHAWVIRPTRHDAANVHVFDFDPGDRHIVLVSPSGHIGAYKGVTIYPASAQDVDTVYAVVFRGSGGTGKLDVYDGTTRVSSTLLDFGTGAPDGVIGLFGRPGVGWNPFHGVIHEWRFYQVDASDAFVDALLAELDASHTLGRRTPLVEWDLAPAGIDDVARTWTAEGGEIVFSASAGSSVLYVDADPVTGLEQWRNEGETAGGSREYLQVASPYPVPPTATVAAVVILHGAEVANEIVYWIDEGGVLNAGYLEPGATHNVVGSRGAYASSGIALEEWTLYAVVWSGEGPNGRIDVYDGTTKQSATGLAWGSDAPKGFSSLLGRAAGGNTARAALQRVRLYEGTLSATELDALLDELDATHELGPRTPPPLHVFSPSGVDDVADEWVSDGGDLTATPQAHSPTRLYVDTDATNGLEGWRNKGHDGAFHAGHLRAVGSDTIPDDATYFAVLRLYSGPDNDVYLWQTAGSSTSHLGRLEEPTANVGGYRGTNVYSSLALATDTLYAVAWAGAGADGEVRIYDGTSVVSATLSWGTSAGGTNNLYLLGTSTGGESLSPDAFMQHFEVNPVRLSAAQIDARLAELDALYTLGARA